MSDQDEDPDHDDAADQANTVGDDEHTDSADSDEHADTAGNDEHTDIDDASQGRPVTERTTAPQSAYTMGDVAVGVVVALVGLVVTFGLPLLFA